MSEHFSTWGRTVIEKALEYAEFEWRATEKMSCMEWMSLEYLSIPPI